MMDHDRMGAQLDVPYTLRVAKLMADELRIKIVMELNAREMSPKEFHEEFGGGSISRVSRAFDLLAEFGWLYQTKTETGGKRRGAVEHFYRAIQPAVFYNDVWAPLPKSMKEMISGGIFEELVERVKEAMEAGTIDARETRHFTWTPLRLDQQGWEAVIARVDAIFHFLFEEQEDANLRMAESGEEPIPMTVALAAFESPKDTKKQH
jgi:predicted transcriptional regulator